MLKFKDWLDARDGLDEGWGRLAPFVAGLGLTGGSPAAQEPVRQDPVHGFSVDELIKGRTSKKVDAGSEHISVWELSREEQIFVEAWGKLKERFDNNQVERSSQFKSVHIRIIKSEEENHQMLVRVEVSAEIQAPDRERAKAMLLNLLMRESGRMRMQHIMIKGLKQAHDLYPSLLQPESVGMQIYKVVAVFTPNSATVR